MYIFQQFMASLIVWKNPRPLMSYKVTCAQDDMCYAAITVMPHPPRFVYRRRGV